MGKPGGAPPRKAPGTALSTRNGARAVLTAPGERIDPPEHITHDRALEAWENFWEDNVSSLITVGDHSLLFRWIDLVQRYWWLVEQADDEPTIHTLNNGQSANPLYKIALSVGNQIEHLEIKLGIGPKNRVSLGLQIVQGETAAHELETRQKRPQTPYTEEDPRVVP
jgi:P27 family predicted phage terminase small subunit